MKKIEISIKGSKVVDVGYRPFLLLNAMNLGIGKVFAYNVEEAVRVRVQGADEKIDQYLDLIRSTSPPHAEVERIEVRDFEGEVMQASAFLQFLQFEQINKAIPAILSIDKKQDIIIEKQDIMIEKQDSMLNKQDSMLNKQDSMLNKQDQTLVVLKGVREDTSAIRNDVSTIKNDVSTLARQTTLEDLEKKYEILSRDIAEIKAEIAEIRDV